MKPRTHKKLCQRARELLIAMGYASADDFAREEGTVEHRRRDRDVFGAWHLWTECRGMDFVEWDHEPAWDALSELVFEDTCDFRSMWECSAPSHPAVSGTRNVLRHAKTMVERYRLKVKEPRDGC